MGLLTGFPGIMKPARKGDITFNERMIFVDARIMQVGIYTLNISPNPSFNSTRGTYNKYQPKDIRNEESPPCFKSALYVIQKFRVWRDSQGN